MSLSSGSDRVTLQGDTVQPDPDSFGVVEGARFSSPYSKMPHWIMFAVSVKARAVYEALYAFRDFWNPSGGNTIRQVPRSILAKLIDVKKADSVDPYIKELEEIGAIEVVRQRIGSMNATNLYVIHTEPPSGYTGPRTVVEYEKMCAVPAGRDVPRSSGVRAKQGKRKPSPIAEPDIDDNSSVPAGRDVPRSSGVRTPPQRGLVPRPSGVKRRSNSKNNPPPSPRTGPAAGAVPEPREGGESSSNSNTEPAAEIDVLVAEVIAARDTWSATAVRTALSHPSVTKRDPEVVRRAILILAADRANTMTPGRLPIDGPWWRAAEKAAGRSSSPARRDSCGDAQCDPVTRRLFTETGQPIGPCPTCNPAASERNTP
jgi:hypothetical protein